jgi:hypothetical protein
VREQSSRDDVVVSERDELKERRKVEEKNEKAKRFM